LKTKSLLCHLASVVVLTISVVSRAEASFIVYIYQSGSNVVATGSGTIDTAGLTSNGMGSTGASVDPGEGIPCLGPTSPGDYDQLTGVSGVSLGSSYTFSSASSGSGDPVGVLPGPQIFVP